MVKYAQTSDTFGLVSKNNLTVQWTAWLSHTRPDAPQLEELEQEVKRLETLAHNVQVLQARDERMQESLTPPPDVEKGIQLPSTDRKPERNPVTRRSLEPTSLPSTPDSNYTPQSWTPTAKRAG